MAYNFATDGYYKCFGDTPGIDPAALRQQTLQYIQNFNAAEWTDKPVQTVLNGQKVPGGQIVDTVNAFQKPNGKQILSPSHVVDQVIGHIKNYRPPQKDLRAPCRRIGNRFVGTLAPNLVGNQCIDFGKQDGITEIDEAAQANKVEERLNDRLFEAEEKGDIVIRRNAVFCGCVSNFSNFLDLSRKVLRHLEVGVPVVVLSRSNTTQHCYRWAIMLLELMDKFSIDLGMLTYVSCDIAEQRRLMAACPESPMHFTGSREIAEKIKEVCPKLIASTGGPNTLLATEFNEKVAEVTRLSNLIENKGQCTALRHFVCPNVNDAMIDRIFEKSSQKPDPVSALADGEFFAILDPSYTGIDNKSNPPKPGYKKCAAMPQVNYKINTDVPNTINEEWRDLYIDVTSPADVRSDAFIQQLVPWLNQKQPITLAVNDNSYDLGLKLFEMTGLCVYTIGKLDNCALTCQARPQEGEVFGEYPPRIDMPKITHLPMINPTPCAAYNAIYDDAFLRKKALSPGSLEGLPDTAVIFYQAIRDPLMKGYAACILEYLIDACREPRLGVGPRTCLFGLQRPPIDGSISVLRCENPLNRDRLLLHMLPFVATNASKQFAVSINSDVPSDSWPRDFVELIERHADNPFDSHDEFTKASESIVVWNKIVVDDPMEFMLAQQFVMRIFPLGHVKSVLSDDTEFLLKFKKSKKWLRLKTRGAQSSGGKDE